MKTLKISNSESYNVYFTNSFDQLNNKLHEIYSSNIKVCIVTDDNVGRIYLNEIIENIHFSTYKYIIPNGEKSKNIQLYSEIIQFLSDNNFSRTDILLSLGGGVVGDLTGFVAATYMRGIDYIQIPTTLLSQVDSSIGSKTAINLKDRKNLIGCFYNPKFVYINTSTLKTLSIKEVYSGYAEIIKHAILFDKSFFKQLLDSKLEVNNDILSTVYKSCQIKNHVVNIDFRENDFRRYLNLGHTFGHAIESLYSEQISHGECVAVGIIFVSYLSFNLGYLSQIEMEEIIDLLSKLLLNIYKVSIDITKIISYIQYDKKNIAGHINWILINKIGECSIHSNITEGEIYNAAKETFKRILN